MGRRPAQPTSTTAPSDLDPAHRKLLASSLDRNDTELAAVDKLNGQLRELRSLLVERYGELSLFPMESTSCPSKTTSLSDNGKEEKERLLLSFRLRLKLRRKLLNRLTRRLNRIAHFMDGDVSSLLPPPNPKYGDIPYEFESEKFSEYKQASAKRELAYEMLQEKRRRLNDNLAEKYMLDAQETISLVDESLGYEKTLDGSEQKLDAVPTLELIEFDVGYDSINKDDQKKLNHEAPEYSALKFGAGVGATHKSMSSKEKEVEFARWSQDILARIPEQPTFEQLGMGDKDVFFLEERKKILLEQLKKQQRSTDNESSSEESYEEKHSEDLKSTNEGVPSIPPADEPDETQSEQIPKNSVYLSLQPVPSFAQQDLRRIRSIHADYVSSTIFKQYKAKVDEAAKEYSETVARSTELQNLKIRLQSDLHKALVYSRSMAQKTRTDVAVARARWERRRDNWEAAQQARRRSQSDTNSRLEIIHMLHLMVDEVERRSVIHPEKINAPTNSITSDDVVSEIVAVTMKDLVNTVVDRNVAPTPGPHGELTFGPTRVVEWNYDLSGESFDDFVAPPIHAADLEYSSSRKQEEQESLLRRQMAAVEARFAASEEDRKRVWRKLQKLRAEFDQQQVHLSTQGSSAQQQQQQVSNTTVNRTRVSAPPSSHQSQTLRHQASSSSSAVQPHSAVATRPTMASETSTSVPTSSRGAMVPSALLPAVVPEAASVSSASQSHPTHSIEPNTSTSNADGVPEALVSAHVAAVESTGSLQSDDGGAQQSSKPGDKYGGKYSVEKVRERIYPGTLLHSFFVFVSPSIAAISFLSVNVSGNRYKDGSVLPVQVPKRNKDGLYQRPAGRQRKGMDWDAERGVWIPLPGYSHEAG